MKKLIFTLIIVTSSMAQAQLGWFLAGALLGGSSSKQVVTQVRDEFSLTVDQIRSVIPLKNSTYSQSPSFEFKTEQSKKIKDYFENEGYKVTEKNNTVIFDFSSQYNAHLINLVEQEEQLKKAKEFMLSLVIYFKIFLGLFLFSLLFYSGIRSFEIMKEMLLRAGPKSFLFKTYDYRGWLTKIHNQRERDQKDNWKIIEKDQWKSK